MTQRKKQAEPQENTLQDTTSITAPEIMSDAPATTASSLNTASSGLTSKPRLAAALVKAQAECQNVPMNRINTHFKSKYADFAAVRDAVVPIFAKHGLAILQVPHHDSFEGFSLETRLIHSSGEELVWRYPLPSDVNKPQAQGSAISYARRYTMSSLAAVASEEDDDASAAQNSYGGGYARGGGASGGVGAVGSVGGNSSSKDGGIVL